MTESFSYLCLPDYQCEALLQLILMVTSVPYIKNVLGTGYQDSDFVPTLDSRTVVHGLFYTL